MQPGLHIRHSTFLCFYYTEGAVQCPFIQYIHINIILFKDTPLCLIVTFFQYDFNIYSNTIDEDLEVNLRVAHISIFGPEGVAPKGDDLPTGEFTYDNPEADPTYGKSGNVPNKPYTFYVSGSVDRWGEDGNIKSADLDESVKPTLKIEKIAQNVYSVEFTAQFKYSEGHWDEDWNWIIDQEWTIPVAYKTDKVVIPDGTKGNYLWAPEKGVLNVDGSTGLGGYLWYIGGATPYGNAFLLPAVSVGTVSIAIVFANNADDYEYALDAYIPTGKYVFSEQPGDRVLIPARYSTSAGSYEAAPILSSYTKITDTYYGVNYVLTGGTVEILEGNTFVFDVTCQTNTETRRGKTHWNLHNSVRRNDKQIRLGRKVLVPSRLRVAHSAVFAFQGGPSGHLDCLQVLTGAPAQLKYFNNFLQLREKNVKLQTLRGCRAFFGPLCITPPEG